MSNDANSQQRAAAEQKISEMVQQSKILESYLNDILTREAALTRLIGEAQLASEGLQSLSSDAPVETMVPLGVGTYVRSTIEPVKNLLVSVGAGIAIEKSRNETISYIESKIKEFEIGIGQLNRQKEQITTRLTQIQNEINMIIQNSSK
jgi:prefoldin alpha subunit